MISQGLEELAEVSALCCFRAFSHLTIMDPTSRVLKDVRQRYTGTFPLWTDFRAFPSHLGLTIIHNTFYSPLPAQLWDRRRDLPCRILWEDYKLSSDEQVILARTPAELVPFECQRRRPYHKVPRWILRFVLHCLSQDPPPPASVVTDCLAIIAVDLDCTVSGTTTLDVRYVHI